MKRLQLNELTLLLACPECGSDVREVAQGIECNDCHALYALFRNCPVLLSEKNELFPASAYGQDENKHTQNAGRWTLTRKLKRLIPKKSINLARERMFHRLSTEFSPDGGMILVVGCGNQTQQLERHFPQANAVFVFCDIDKQADTDVFCDSHELSFKDGAFDGVISTAVLEHVLYPDKVISEIHRVLKKGAFIYSEIPFLQSVHEGAYDFTRFSMSGHRRLLEGFEEIDAGMVAGPGTALTWSIVDLSRSLSANRKISSLLSIAARFLFFWLKYFDFLAEKNPVALDAASCTYFYGVKIGNQTSPAEIIRRYEGGKFAHS